MSTLRYIIFGTGSIAGKHAAAIQAAKNSALVGVISRDFARAQGFARRFGIKAYRSYEDVLEDTAIDAIDITTINNLHAGLGIQAAESGKHVLVEKPIDIDVKKAGELVAACKKNKVKLSVISQLRFGKLFLDLKKRIEAGELGNIFLAGISAITSRDQGYYDSSGGWRKTIAESGGGVLLNYAIHRIDIMRYLLGEFESVLGTMGTSSHKIEVEDSAAGVIKFKNGSACNIKTSTCAVNSKQPDILELHGTKGSVAVSMGAVNRYVYWRAGKSRRDALMSYAKCLSRSFGRLRKGTLQNQVEDFSDAVLSGRQPLVSGEDGLADLKIIQAFYKSAKTGKQEFVA